MPPKQQKRFDTFSRKRLYLVLLIGTLVVAGQLPGDLAHSRYEGSHETALQSCPPVQEEIVDLQVLADGLKKSRAVGFFEKLSLKSSIDDLIHRFEDYHSGARKFSLEELQQQYDILLMRIASHLQHQDVLLHQQLCNAWEVIWKDLSDSARFSEKFT